MSKKDAEIVRLVRGWMNAKCTISHRDIEIVDLKNYIQKLETARNLLGGLVCYLLRNYPDDQWDSETRKLLEEANSYLGEPPIVWNIDYGMDSLEEYDEH